jgi:hypothetical protein
LISSDKINTTNISTYSFIDKHPFAGINYYRLKQIDIDGAYSYSKVVALSFDESNMEWEIWAYPNPANEYLHLQLSNALTSKMAVTVYNSVGQKVIEQEIKSRDLTTSLPIQHLENGVYIVHCSTQDFSKIVKIVVQK